ncbi:unnamed protein product [Protopolystoma xenopodis]|uniref:Uncharacterized protein n=1 Tax=Protopolystoma xenopodis TaxID=117903 RepID=A0A3S5C9C1_9PLAT|nr:unnamed protein product [Protopolystoma xenopodis]
MSIPSTGIFCFFGWLLIGDNLYPDLMTKQCIYTNLRQTSTRHRNRTSWSPSNLTVGSCWIWMGGQDFIRTMKLVTVGFSALQSRLMIDGVEM